MQVFFKTMLSWLSAPHDLDFLNYFLIVIFEENGEFPSVFSPYHLCLASIFLSAEACRILRIWSILSFSSWPATSTLTFSPLSYTIPSRSADFWHRKATCIFQGRPAGFRTDPGFPLPLVVPLCRCCSSMDDNYTNSENKTVWTLCVTV